MLEFPGLAKRVEEIQGQNREALDLAARMFSTWINFPIIHWLRESELFGVILSLSYMLHFQACRQFRSVVELCKIGEGANAIILTRSLFETALAANFNLAETLYIVVAPKLGQKYGNPPKQEVLKDTWIARAPWKGEQCAPLSREKRALIYEAHCMAQGYKVAKGISERQLAATGEVLELDTDILDAAKRRLGPEWAYIQSHRPHTYSGLNLKDLADVSGRLFQNLYTTYSDQSREVHGVDPISKVNVNHATGEVGAQWFSRDNTIKEVLFLANTLFFTFAITLNNNIGLGEEMDKALEGYFEELQTVYKYNTTIA
ncbi:MAG: hypothetical protein WD738_01365 [Pirellulales bacterium]